MADQKRNINPAGVSEIALPNVLVPIPRVTPDYATLLGFVFAISLIVIAIYLGNSDASFFNVPSLLIVLFGTMAVTAISFTGAELVKAGDIIVRSLFRKVYDPIKLAEALLGLCVIAKKKGLLAVAQTEKELMKDPFLHQVLQMAIDGNKPEDIDFIVSQDIASLSERHKRSAQLTRRAAETAPAMGLIGTLVGLVQMLADLENPDSIGPAMAVALLTTFYGAILGTVVMAPLTVKLDKNSQDEALIRHMIRLTAVAIARQDSPRKLELALNSILPPTQQIRYFD